MCYLQEPPFNMEAPKKKARKAKNKTGVEVVQSVLKTPEPPMIENAEPLTQEWTAPLYTTGDNFRMQKYLDPEPQMNVNENAQPATEIMLPSYEDMMCEDLFNGPSSMEAQPDLAPVNVLEEGVAVTQDGRTVEWWPIEGEFDVPDLEELALQEYVMDASRPLHTNFVLPEQNWLSLCQTCPVYFGNADSKQTVLKTICNSIHPKLQEEWGSFSCHCRLIPRLKLSQTPRNPNKVFLCCPKEREARCNYFQWIHQAPKPLRVPKACSRSVLKKRMHDMVQKRLQMEKGPKEVLKKRMHEMVQEKLQKRPKVEAGGFQFP